MSTPADIGFSLNSPPTEAIAYLKQKGYALSFDFDELMHETHHQSFTVAKVMQLDLLTDIHQSLLQAQASGTPYQQWAKDLIPTLQAKGWWGKTEVYNPDTGEYKTITVDGRRLSTIYHTNINTSYAVARYRELNELPEEFAYWRYHAVMDARTRPTHAAKHGTILPKTSDWWKINYPPNGWRCRCKVFAYTKGQIDRKGWKVQEKDPPRIADVDWGYDIGAGSARIDQVYFQKVQALTCNENNARKRNTDCSFANQAQETYKKDMIALALASYQLNKEMPEPRRVSLPLSTATTASAFMKEVQDQFDDTIFTAITTDKLAIDSDLFTTHAGDWKFDKRDRAQWLNYMVLNIKEPDEVWRYFDAGMEVLVFMSRFTYGKNNTLQLIAKFEREEGSGNAFTGVTTFPSDDTGYLTRERRKIEQLGGEINYRLDRWQ